MSDHSITASKNEIAGLKEDLELLKRNPAQFEKMLIWEIAHCKKNSANSRMCLILFKFNQI